MWNQIKTFLKGLISDITGFLTPLAKQIAKSGGQLLLQAALDAVMAAEKQGGSGSAKFKAARASVVASLQTNGVPLIENAIQGAILAAVAKLNEGK